MYRGYQKSVRYRRLHAATVATMVCMALLGVASFFTIISV